MLGQLSQNRVDIRPKLEAATQDFCKAIGYPNGRFIIKGALYRYDHIKEPKKEPVLLACERAGCYILANDAGQILYVGKGSRHMGNRIWDPFGRRGRDGEADPFPDAKAWVKEDKPGVWAICVPEEHWWLAMALEFFLIERVKNSGEPLKNKLLR